MKDEEEPFRCQATAKRETPKALLVELEDGTERWIPKSAIHDDSEVYDSTENATGEIVIHEWFARKEGLS